MRSSPSTSPATNARVTPTADVLGGLLRGSHEGHGHGYGVDEGIGVEGQPVVGLTFWVRAEDVGTAAMTAVDTARRAGAAAGAGPDYYDVSLVPRSVIAGSKDEHEIRIRRRRSSPRSPRWSARCGASAGSGPPSDGWSWRAG